MLTSLLLCTALFAAPQAHDNPAEVTSIRISGGVAAKRITKMVEATYPEEARKKHIQGRVNFLVHIDKDGNVKDLKLVSGPPELIAAATDAVKQWKYEPYDYYGHLIEVETTAIVEFNLKKK